MSCELCKRDRSTTFHHLIPKKVHNKTYIKNKLNPSININTYGIHICSDCHSMIHQKIDHYNLALQYNSLEKLLDHPEIQKFVKWVSKQNKKVKKK